MIDQPSTVYERPGSRKSMPVSYAILKFGNVLPLDEPPDDDVVELSPLELELEPPQPAATSASPAAAKAAVVTSHPLLRVKWVPPRCFRVVRQRRSLCLSAREILPDCDISTPEEPVLLEAEHSPSSRS